MNTRPYPNLQGERHWYVTQLTPYKICSTNEEHSKCITTTHPSPNLCERNWQETRHVYAVASDIINTWSFSDLFGRHNLCETRFISYKEYSTYDGQSMINTLSSRGHNLCVVCLQKILKLREIHQVVKLCSNCLVHIHTDL